MDVSQVPQPQTQATPAIAAAMFAIAALAQMWFGIAGSTGPSTLFFRREEEPVAFWTTVCLWWAVAAGILVYSYT